MSYQVLARKWRPRTFKDMVGQEPILRMLANALEQKRLHHAYLLTGTRGVGKTTLARILAKCLNCEVGMSAEPCGTCETCRAIDNGQFLDLYEIDAASRTKVEDTRELLDNVMYPPTQGRYKVYLIDEVHMLSNHSFNALLKTLEEPPEHVKFLLATTDPKKLPVTILSRCLQFHLKRMLPEQIAGHLQHVCEAEGITHEVDAFKALAKAADGSMRDALSLLDQAIAYGHGSVNTTDVYAMLGSMAQDDLLPLLEALATRDGKRVFQVMAQLSERSPDFEQVLEELIGLFHQIAMAQVIPDTAANPSITQYAKYFSPEDVQLYYQIALLGRRDLSIAPSLQQGFEMTLIRMLAFNPVLSHATPAVSPPQTITSTTKTKEPAPITHASPITPSAPVTMTDSNWSEILPKLGLTGMAYALASNCVLAELSETKVKLNLSESHQAMLNQKLKERINEAFNQYLNRTIQLDIQPTAGELATPSKLQNQANNERLTQAKTTMLNDPTIKKLIDMYDATVEVSLV